MPNRKTEITASEMWDAIPALKNNKATSLDQITAELLKCGEDTVVAELRNLINKCWQIGMSKMNGKKGSSSSKFMRKETWLNVETGGELHLCQSLVKSSVWFS